MSTIRIITISEVQRRSGLSRPTIYRYMQQKKFPGQVRRGSRNVGWVEHEIEEYIEQCVRDRREQD